MDKLDLGVLFGGASTEHEVSRRSCFSILEKLDNEKYNIRLLGITKKGEWYLYTGDYQNISTDAWEKDVQNKKRAFISPSTEKKGIIILNEDQSYSHLNLDVIFPVFHGRNGEDGTMQGLFELAQIPYVGCDVLSSCCCMDKIFTNIILTQAGIKKAKFAFLDSFDFDNDEKTCLDYIEKEISSYPMFVKPSNSGSSVGVSKVKNIDELKAAIILAKRYDSRILIEENIVGQEVECAVLGNHKTIASIIGEIAPANDFYDYEAKYVSDSGLYIPAHISDETSEKIRKIAQKAYTVMGCKGLARVDFFVEKGSNEVLLNEINTMPGFTSISMYPKLMEQIGIGYSDLLDKLIALAVERFKENER
ncbi:MAG: D-alanine--D-alanine ligase [Clostridia bacterium]|nr:D-alanine--D-alanine ligase [Clostridia bacterium]